MNFEDIDKIPDIVSNTDKIRISDVSDTDIAAFAATWLLEKGYPALHIDHFSLQHDFLKKNYNTEEDDDNTKHNL